MLEEGNIKSWQALSRNWSLVFVGTNAIRIWIRNFKFDPDSVDYLESSFWVELMPPAFANMVYLSSYSYALYPK